MAVAFDASSAYGGESTTTFSWTHTPVGTPKGVAIVITQGEYFSGSSLDKVAYVSYGGGTFATRKATVAYLDSPSACRHYIYFLSAPPSGAQTIEVGLSGGSGVGPHTACAFTVTASNPHTTFTGMEYLDVLAGTSTPNTGGSAAVMPSGIEREAVQCAVGFFYYQTGHTFTTSDILSSSDTVIHQHTFGENATQTCISAPSASTHLFEWTVSSAYSPGAVFQGFGIAEGVQVVTIDIATETDTASLLAQIREIESLQEVSEALDISPLSGLTCPPQSVQDESSFRSVFMGDVLVTSATVTLTMSVTVSGPTTYVYSTTLYRGSWFATPLSLIQYLVEKWNESGTPDGLGAWGACLCGTSGRIRLTPDLSYGAITAASLTISDAVIAEECGLEATTQNLGAIGTAVCLPNAMSFFLSPVWPIHAYERGVEPLSGYASRSHNGTTYSFAGNWRSTVSLGVTLDMRDGDYTEFQLWRTLWARRWAAGRAVTFYMDEADLPSEWDEDLTDADVLVVASTPDRLGGRRSIDWNSAHAELRDVYTFALYRPPYPDPLVYEVPSAIVRLSASVGEV